MAPAGLGQHARRRPISREGASARPPLRAGEGTLPVYGAVQRALVAVPVGMITAWRIKNWECVSSKPAHKGSVTELDVHPSGKVMLS